MADYQIMSWYGIPTGVKASDESGQVREKLPLRFQAAVDAAATATSRTETKAYLKGWQWSEAETRPGAARAVAQQIAAEMIEAYPPERVKALRQELEEKSNGESA